jgi:hypothetical protein
MGLLSWLRPKASVEIREAVATAQHWAKSEAKGGQLLAHSPPGTASKHQQREQQQRYIEYLQKQSASPVYPGGHTRQSLGRAAEHADGAQQQHKQEQEVGHVIRVSVPGSPRSPAAPSPLAPSTPEAPAADGALPAAGGAEPAESAAAAAAPTRRVSVVSFAPLPTADGSISGPPSVTAKLADVVAAALRAAAAPAGADGAASAAVEAAAPPPADEPTAEKAAAQAAPAARIRAGRTSSAPIPRPASAPPQMPTVGGGTFAKANLWAKVTDAAPARPVPLHHKPPVPTQRSLSATMPALRGSPLPVARSASAASLSGRGYSGGLASTSYSGGLASRSGSGSLVSRSGSGSVGYSSMLASPGKAPGGAGSGLRPKDEVRAGTIRT